MLWMTLQRPWANGSCRRSTFRIRKAEKLVFVWSIISDAAPRIGSISRRELSW